MKYYTLKFEAGTITEIKGSKADLVAELQNLINEIIELDDDYFDSREIALVTLYDMNGSDFIEAQITE